PHMPPWGSKQAKLGNNPIVFAVPREEGHIVFDTAMSQFSYGKLLIHRDSGEPLPVDGGYDQDGNLTRDAGLILAAKRMLPIGYWKGSGMAFMLDLLAMMISGGNGVLHIGKVGTDSHVSQIFIAIDATRFSDVEETQAKIRDVISDLHAAEPDEQGGQARYPGEETMRVRERNLREGIPVDEAIWRRVLEMDAQSGK
ncbi:MAG: malate/lactate dehydrogenase, partial [Paenibacillus sp.]|nr:malate/lactate dehydrogenase [Paenibacillus sp.]